MKFDNAVNIQGQDVKSLGISTNVAVTVNPLDAGVYAVWSTVETFIKVDQTKTVADDVTTTTGYPVRINATPIQIRIASPSFLAGIAGGNGTMYYQRVG